MLEAALLIGAYFLGAVPFGYLIARAHGINIFEVGSGNVGATNVKRALGLKWALFVFLLDVAKGAVPTLVAGMVLASPEWPMLVGAAAILGHCLSPFLRFRGGKGISTTLGVALASAPLVALSAFGVWIVCLALCRYVSLSSMIAVPSGLLFCWLFGEPPSLYLFYGALSLFVLATHRTNIGRLLNGTESKFSLKGNGRKKEPGDVPQKEELANMSRKAYRTHPAGEQRV